VTAAEGAIMHGELLWCGVSRCFALLRNMNFHPN